MKMFVEENKISPDQNRELFETLKGAVGQISGWRVEPYETDQNEVNFHVLPRAVRGSSPEVAFFITVDFVGLRLKSAELEYWPKGAPEYKGPGIKFAQYTFTGEEVRQLYMEAVFNKLGSASETENSSLDSLSVPIAKL